MGRLKKKYLQKTAEIFILYDYFNTFFQYIAGRQKYGIGCEITRKSSQFYGTTENNRSYG